MQAPEHFPPDKPPRVHGYDMLGKLGRSGASSVWKARQILLGRIVAIKIISEQQTRDPEEILRFKRGALIAAGLKHPGIVQVYDFGQLADSVGYYFVMEFISGYSVGDWFRRKGRLEETAVLSIAYSAAEALLYAWETASLVHCNIKPENIMVDGDGTIKITDLGLAQAARSIDRQGEIASAISHGSDALPYMAPEQLQGEKTLDCRADIYGLGATLYHIATGCLPFETGASKDGGGLQIRTAVEDPRSKQPALSAGTAGMIMKMLAQDTGHRYRDWKEVMSAVSRLEQAPVKAGPAKVAASASDTIPLRVFGGSPSDPGGDQAGLPPAPPDDFKECPYCAEPIRKRAIYCRFCGKDLQKKHGPPGRPEAPRKFKSLQTTASPFPAAAPSEAPAPLLKPGRGERVWGNIRMAISLLLLVFLGYYGYQKLVHHRDIMAPIREELRRKFSPAGAGVARDVPIRPAAPRAAVARPVASRTPAPAASQFSTAPAAWPAPVSLPEPPEYIPAADSAAEKWTEDPALRDAALAPLSETEEQRIRKTEEYRQLLRQCEQSRPVVGREVVLKLKYQQEPLRGVLDDYQADRLFLTIPQGKVSVPYRIMDEPTRRLFFPEDNAMYAYRQKYRRP